MCIAPATVDLRSGKFASDRVSESVAKLAPRVKGVDVTETISALRKQERIFRSSDKNTAARHQRFRSGIYPRACSYSIAELYPCISGEFLNREQAVTCAPPVLSNRRFPQGG